jgi:hypothetical protein
LPEHCFCAGISVETTLQFLLCVLEITGNLLYFTRNRTSLNLTEISFEMTRNHFNTIKNGEIIDKIWIVFESTGNHVIITLSIAIDLIEVQDSQNWNISITSVYAWLRIENINKLYYISIYALAKRLQWKLRKKRTQHMLNFD